MKSENFLIYNLKITLNQINFLNRLLRKGKSDLNEILVINEAFKRGIKISKSIKGRRILSFKGKNSIIRLQETGEVGKIITSISNNKYTCKKFLEKYKISTPKGKLFEKDEFNKALKIYKNINKKIICKPNNSELSRFVFLNFDSEKDFKNAFDKIIGRKHKVLIEEFVQGTEYRIFATEKGFIAAIKKDFPEIVGDGVNTIKKLINLKNKKYLKKWKNKKIKEKNKIHMNKIDLDKLKKNGFSLNQILPKGGKIFLKINSGNICEGRESETVEDIHPSVKKIIFKIIKEVLPGIRYAGIDIISKKSSLSEPHGPKDYSIIEVNCRPELTPLHFPDKGRPQNAAGAILDTIFPCKNDLINKNITETR